MSEITLQSCYFIPLFFCPVFWIIVYYNRVYHMVLTSFPLSPFFNSLLLLLICLNLFNTLNSNSFISSRLCYLFLVMLFKWWRLYCCCRCSAKIPSTFIFLKRIWLQPPSWFTKWTYKSDSTYFLQPRKSLTRLSFSTGIFFPILIYWKHISFCIELIYFCFWYKL